MSNSRKRAVQADGKKKKSSSGSARLLHCKLLKKALIIQLYSRSHRENMNPICSIFNNRRTRKRNKRRSDNSYAPEVRIRNNHKKIG